MSAPAPTGYIWLNGGALVTHYALTGSLIGSNTASTTYAVGCGTRLPGEPPLSATPTCSLPKDFQWTGGPQGFQYITDYYLDDSDVSIRATTTSSCTWGSVPFVATPTASAKAGLNCLRVVTWANSRTTSNANGALNAYPVTLAANSVAANPTGAASGPVISLGPPLLTTITRSGSVVVSTATPPAPGTATGAGGAVVTNGAVGSAAGLPPSKGAAAPAAGLSEMSSFGGLLAVIAVWVGLL